MDFDLFSEVYELFLKRFLKLLNTSNFQIMERTLLLFQSIKVRYFLVDNDTIRNNLYPKIKNILTYYSKFSLSEYTL